MLTKFNIGDRVKVNGHSGEIIQRRHGAFHGHEFKVKFDKSDLIGTNGWFLEDSVKLLGPSIQNECPWCGSKWKETKSPVLGEVWYDCPKCKKSKEEILGDTVVKNWEQELDDLLCGSDDLDEDDFKI